MTEGRRMQLVEESVAGRRDHNEDSVLSTSLSDGRTLLAVADGMGGHAAGEVASALALEILVEAIEAGEALDAACRQANERVHAMASSDVGKQGMGTTLVTMLLDGDTYEIANVGDSRGYRLTADGIEQITDDHSFVAEAVKRGQSEEEAKQSKWKDALTRSIGTAADVEVDVFGPFEVSENEAIMLCSDGLFKALTDTEMRHHFGTADDLEEVAQVLVSAAFDGGSDDNISIVIAEFGRVPRGEFQVSSGMDAPTLVLDEPFEAPDEPEPSDHLAAEADSAPAEEEPAEEEEVAAEVDEWSEELPAAGGGGAGLVVAAGLVAIVVVAALLIFL